MTDRDRGVRAAALGVMEVAYRQEGPAAFWKLVGRVSDQQRSLIEERLKYTDKQASAQVGTKRLLLATPRNLGLVCRRSAV